MKKLNIKFMGIIAILTTLLAASMASSACWWCSYQPEEPKILREK